MKFLIFTMLLFLALPSFAAESESMKEMKSCLQNQAMKAGSEQVAEQALTICFTMICIKYPAETEAKSAEDILKSKASFPLKAVNSAITAVKLA